MKLIKAMTTVGGFTGISRIAGFVRDILTASIVGAGPAADAFFVALKLPNFFRRVTAEGAFSVSFVPLYSETLEKDGAEAARSFASNAMAVMFCFLLAFTALAMMAMPYVIYVIAPGFQDDPVRYPLAIELTRITFPYLLLVSLAALVGGVLNAHGRFAPFAVAPALFNIAIIVALLLADVVFKTPSHAMAWGIFAAGFLQFGLLCFFAVRMKIMPRFVRPRFDDRIKKLFKLMAPGALGAGVMQINLFVDLIIASLLPAGSISYLYYADRLNQLPLGIVGVAVGTALLPMLSRALAAGQSGDAKALFNRAMEASLFLALPAATGLFIVSFPIIVTLFRHGEFGMQDAAMTTAVLTAYALGIPPYVASKVYSTAYWARQDTFTPVKAGIASVVFNIAMALFLVFYAKIGVMGIAVATSMAGYIQIFLLHRGLKTNEAARFDERFKRSFLKITASCVAMGAYLYLTKPYFLDMYLSEESGHTEQIFGLAVLVGGGMAIYAAGVVFSGVIKPQDFKAYFKKQTV